MSNLLSSLVGRVPELVVLVIVLFGLMKYFQNEMKAERQLCRSAIERLTKAFNRLAARLECAELRRK